MSKPTLVSVLHPAARTKDGADRSHTVVDTAPLTADLVCSEGWSPPLYKNNHRKLVNFLSASVIGFDIDEKMTLEEAKAALAPFKHIIATTVSHQKWKGKEPPCDRFRVIVFLSEPVTTAEDYKQTFLTIAANLKLPFDKQAKDAARWFVPCAEVVSENKDGWPAPTYKAAEVTSQRPAAPPPSSQPTSERGRLSKATRDFLAQEPSVNGEGWHIRFVKAAMDFKEQGYTIGEAEQRLRAASTEFELDETDLKQLDDVYNNRGGALPMRASWPEMLVSRSGDTRPDPASVANQRHLLTEILGYKFMLNSRRSVVYYTVKTDAPDSSPRLLSDELLAMLNTAARTHRLQAGDSLRDLIITMAREEQFDPLMDKMEQLTWDGGQHIQALFETIRLPASTTAEQRSWYALYLRRWLVGLVTKLYHPGSENNVLVFQGEQAAGKSRWLKRLAELWPEGFGEGHVSPDDKDHELRHLDNFIWHVAEFDSTTSRREVGALKDYFTKDTVSVRRPYARLPIVGRSICSFCASVNSHEFLHDATGNRRYLVIPIEGVDAGHSVSIPQVFAEAKAAMLAGERQWFTREEIAAVNALNSNFLSKEEYLEAIAARCRPGDQPISLARLMEQLGFSSVQLTRPIRSNIRTLLERNRIQTRVVHGVTCFLLDERLLRGPLPSEGNQPRVLTLKGKS